MEKINDLAELFKLFGDETRLRILLSLFEKERNVGELEEALNLTQSAISHQLKNLKNGRLIQSRRQGQTVIYSLCDDHVYRIIEQGMSHIKE